MDGRVESRGQRHTLGWSMDTKFSPPALGGEGLFTKAKEEDDKDDQSRKPAV
jgi:hypothetical protein